MSFGTGLFWRDMANWARFRTLIVGLVLLGDFVFCEKIILYGGFSVVVDCLVS